MKTQKYMIYKPSTLYTYSKTEKETISEKTSPFLLKEFLKEILIKILVLGLIFLNLISLAAAGYKGYVFFRYKVERKALEEENKQLNEEYKKLTSQDVLLEKAKSLGLRPPQEEDYLRIEK